MKLIFTYVQHKEQIIPACYLGENHQLNPLTGYLNDPMSGPNYFSFLNHSLSILTDETIQEADISSNSWSAEVMNNQVNFYFLFAQEEESLYLVLPRGIMVDVLRLWLTFRSQESEEGLIQRLESQIGRTVNYQRVLKYLRIACTLLPFKKSWQKLC